MTDTIAFEEATLPQLRAYAQLALGLKPKETDDEFKLRAIITKGAGVELKQIPILDLAPIGTPGVNGRGRVFTGDNGRQYMRIMIPEQEKAGGDQHVPAVVNGELRLIERNKEIDLEVEFVEVIANAVAWHYEQDGNGLSKPKKVPEYPITYL